MESSHLPVLAAELVDSLAPQPGQNIIDCTLGAGGHAWLVLQRLAGEGQLLAIDVDPLSFKKAAALLSSYQSQVIYRKANYRNLAKIVKELNWSHCDAIYLDLGLSSFSLDQADRGFSFQVNGPLDMRLLPEEQSLTASDIVNKWSERELSDLFFDQAAEKYSKSIAAAIVKARQGTEIKETEQLREIIWATVPMSARKKKRHPATKVFLALRMRVNQEVEALKSVLADAWEVLSSGGKLAVITFHSGEDKIVKDIFKKLAQEGGQVSHFDLGVKRRKRPFCEPSYWEIKNNPRSRSARLRVITK